MEVHHGESNNFKECAKPLQFKEKTLYKNLSRKDLSV